MPAGLAPSVMFGSDPGPGVYVLEFADGSEYVGQIVHPISRLATHRRRYKDIVAVRFTSVDRADLDRVEQEIITGLRNEGVLLRNRTLLSQPLGKSALDAIVSQEDQAAWISADFQDADVVVAPERIELARARILAGSSPLWWCSGWILRWGCQALSSRAVSVSVPTSLPVSSTGVRRQRARTSRPR